MKKISDGPFFMGDKFGIVDILLAPHVDRFPAIENKGFVLPETGDYDRFRSWFQAVKEVPSFKSELVDADFVKAQYGKYGKK